MDSGPVDIPYKQIKESCSYGGALICKSQSFCPRYIIWTEKFMFFNI